METEQEVIFCRYLSGGPTIQDRKKCSMIGSVQLGPRHVVDILTEEYVSTVCNHEPTAKSVCPHYQELRKAEGISRRMREITEEVNGLVSRLSSYEAQPELPLKKS